LEDSDDLSKVSHAFSQRPQTESSSRIGNLIASPSGGKAQLNAQKSALAHTGRVMKALGGVIKGKSALVLTDKQDVRKSVTGSCMGALNSFCFLKSTNELWQQLQDKREQHHVLVIDLARVEMQVESVISTIRQHPRYGKIPIIVLSENRDLSEQVRSSCSFVVFKPIVASMMREALLWCLDKRVLQNVLRQESVDPGTTAESLKVMP
jgi:CheY-like chemotaxis protein